MATRDLRDSPAWHCKVEIAPHMRCLRLAHATTGASAGPCVQSAQACCVLSLPDKCRPHEHTARGWLQPQSTGHSSSHPKGRQITTDHNNGAGVGAGAGRGTTKARNGKGPHPSSVPVPVGPRHAHHLCISETHWRSLPTAQSYHLPRANAPLPSSLSSSGVHILPNASEPRAARFREASPSVAPDSSSLSALPSPLTQPREAPREVKNPKRKQVIDR